MDDAAHLGGGGRRAARELLDRLAVRSAAQLLEEGMGRREQHVWDAAHLGQRWGEGEGEGED